MIQKKNMIIEFIIAFIIMTLVLYIFIRRTNNRVIIKLNTIDTVVNITNQNLKNINENILFLYPFIDTLNEKSNYSINKQYEILDSLTINNQLLRKNNKILEQQFDYIKQINRKQNIITDSLKKRRIVYLP